MKRFPLKKIKENSLCLGCGLCEATSPDIKMLIDNKGFIVPDADNDILGESAEILNSVCPAINISCIPSKPSQFGNILEANEGWAVNEKIRYHASSGGVITALSIYLLDSRKVNGIIQVRRKPNHYMHNEVVISRSPEEVKQCSASRYAPVSMLTDILKWFSDNPNEIYAFVGKPCDIATLKRLINFYPEYQNRINYYISLVCAGTPSYHATEKLISIGKNGDSIIPTSVKYRGDGWPGEFKVEYNNNSIYKCDYNASWGKILGRNLNFRCKICPDGIGKYADIVVGDSWHTKNGYPDFSEQDGKSFVLIRTIKGLNLYNDAFKSSYVSKNSMDINNLKEVQPYQYQRLLYAGYKLIGAKICIGNILKISHLSFHSNTLIRGFRSMLGTIKRFRRK